LATSVFFSTVALFAADAPMLRLDGSVVPKQYRLDLTVNPREDKYQGSLEMDVILRSASSLIWLNAAGLTVESVAIRTSRPC
jgi:hypothetical protein